MNTTFSKYIGALVLATTVTGLATVSSAFAETSSPGTSTQNSYWLNHGPGNGRGPGMNGMNGMKPGIFGTVTAVSGTTLTVSGRSLGENSATTTYSVDASGATVSKDHVTSTVSAITINDRVFVSGTISGTSVTATRIIDGMGGRGSPGNMGNGRSGTMPPITGNGQPVVAGTVSMVNGTSFTITTSSNTSYTIDASLAKVVENGTTTSASITPGAFTVIQGTINGTSVVATSVIIEPVPGSNPGNNGNGPMMHPDNGSHGFFSSIGNFFRHIFGF